MIIQYSPKFEREYRKLPERIKTIAEGQERLFRSNPFHPALKTHKLKGPLKDFWAFSIGYRYRIILEFTKNQTVHFHSVGTHDIYQ